MTEAGFGAAIVRDSVVCRAGDWMLTRVGKAWTTSLTARIWAAAGSSDRTKFWSVAVIAAALTVLAASPLGTTPRPLAWLVPVFAAALAALVLVMSPRGTGSRSV